MVTTLRAREDTGKNGAGDRYETPNRDDFDHRNIPMLLTPGAYWALTPRGSNANLLMRRSEQYTRL